MANSDHQHATPFGDDNQIERLPEELRQVARRYAQLPVPHPTSEETNRLIARLQISTGQDLSPLPVRPPRRRRRISPFLEMLAAVLVVGILVGSFLLVLASRLHQPPAQQSAQGEAQNIIVSVSANNKIFSGAPMIVANRASDGKKIWSYVIDQQFAVPTVITVQAHVVYARGKEQVYALRASDGKLLWHISLPWPSSALGYTPDFSHDTGGIVVDHGMVFTQLLDGVSETAVLFALRANDGRVLWQYQTGGEELFTVANGKVYAAAYLDNTYQLVALQETTGHVLWSYDGAISSIAQQDNRVYVVSIMWTIPQGGTPLDAKPGGTLLALSAQHGKVLWSSKIVTTFAASADVGRMLIEKDRLIFFNGNHVCAYRISDGHELWCSHGPGDTSGVFALVNPTIYTLGGQGITQLEALDSTTGTVLWSKNVLDPQSSLHGLIALMVDKIYLLVSRPSGAESIYALSLNDGHQLWQYDFPFMTVATAAGS